MKECIEVILYDETMTRTQKIKPRINFKWVLPGIKVDTGLKFWLDRQMKKLLRVWMD